MAVASTQCHDKVIYASSFTAQQNPAAHSEMVEIEHAFEVKEEDFSTGAGVVLNITSSAAQGLPGSFHLAQYVSPTSTSYAKKTKNETGEIKNNVKREDDDDL